MTDLILQEKLAFYIQKKNELVSDTYGLEEIEAKVQEYRNQLIAEKNEEKSTDIAKVDSYIEVLTELINEFAKNEISSETNVDNTTDEE